MPPDTILSPEVVGFNSEGTRELRGVLGEDKVFPQPKPARLIRYLLQLANDPDAIVLDFFAGSGTTGHAVMAQNVEDGGRRRHFLVQLPEPVDEEDNQQQMAAAFLKTIGKPFNIAELTKERLRRASSSLGEGATASTDLGFRVFKLDSSNVRAWEPDKSDFKQSVIDYVDHIKPDRSEDDLFYELLLKLGYDLCAPMEQRVIAGKRVNAVAGGALVACMAESIKKHEVDELTLGIVALRDEMEDTEDIMVFFRDNAFEDEVAKSNVTEILRQYDIKDVRSL